MAVEEGAAGVRRAVGMAKQAFAAGCATGEHRHALRRECLVLRPPGPQEITVEDDVGVEDLAGPGVHPGGAHGEARSGRDPAKRVVVDVLGIPVGGLRLLADLDRGGKAGLLKRVIPRLDAFSDGLPILERHGLLDPEHDRLLGGRDRGRGVSLFEIPSVDVANETILVDLLREVLEGRHEVADAVVGEPGLVAVLRQQAE